MRNGYRCFSVILRFNRERCFAVFQFAEIPDGSVLCRYLLCIAGVIDPLVASLDPGIFFRRICDLDRHLHGIIFPKLTVIWIKAQINLRQNGNLARCGNIVPVFVRRDRGDRRGSVSLCSYKSVRIDRRNGCVAGCKSRGYDDSIFRLDIL